MLSNMRLLIMLVLLVATGCDQHVEAVTGDQLASEPPLPNAAARMSQIGRA